MAKPVSGALTLLYYKPPQHETGRAAAAAPLSGRGSRTDARKSPIDLSSLISPGAAILPFATVLALCVFLLSLPPAVGVRITNSSLVSVPQPIEVHASPPASAEDPPSERSFPQAPPVEVGASLPVIAASAVDTTSDAVSMMAIWWAERSRYHAAPPKTAVSVRQYRRHRGVVRREPVAVGKTE
jgi:hypothetical protein